MKSKIELAAIDARLAAGGRAHGERVTECVGHGADAGCCATGNAPARLLALPAVIERRFHFGAELMAEWRRIRAQQRAKEQPPDR